MKLVNRKTGEIGYLYEHSLVQDTIIVYDVKGIVGKYKTITELCEEWEDATEEPKSTIKDVWFNSTIANGHFVEIDFISDEEAEKAVEKLKAWKRLKEAGFEFGGWTHTPITKSLTGYNLHIKAYSDKLADYMDDLQLLFGGEE